MRSTGRITRSERRDESRAVAQVGILDARARATYGRRVLTAEARLVRRGRVSLSPGARVVIERALVFVLRPLGEIAFVVVAIWTIRHKGIC